MKLSIFLMKLSKNIVSLRQKHRYLILVGNEDRPEKSASWAPWLKSSRRWVRLGHLWASSLRTSTVIRSQGSSRYFRLRPNLKISINPCREPLSEHRSCDSFIDNQSFIPISDQLYQELYWWNINPGDFWSERHKTPQPGVLTQSFPLPADPGADWDEGLVGDVAQDVEQHLVRALINVAIIMYHHVVTSSLAVLHIQGTDPTCSGERNKIADLAVHSQVHTYYEKDFTVINGNCNNDPHV